MEENRKELLAELYCLRAGMSALSQESEKLKGEDDRLKAVTVKIEDNTAEIINYNAIVNSSKKTLKSAKHDYNKAKREYDKKSFPLWVHSIFTVCLFILAGYLYYIRKPDSDYVLLFDILLGATLVLALIELIRSALLNRKVKPLRIKMKNAKQLMIDSKTWISESEKGAKLVEGENRGLGDRKNEYGLSRADAVSISVPMGEALHAALVRNFEGIIGQSYYRALDFIIELIRSGKSESITAALITVDNKKALGRLEEAVNTAHQNLLSYIEEDMAELSAELDVSYSRLEKIISEENERAIEKIKSSKTYISGSVDEIRASFMKTNSKDNIRSALAARSKISSLVLADDLDYILCHNR